MRRMIAVLTVLLVAALFCSPAAASITAGDTYRIDWHKVAGQSQGPFEFIRVSPTPSGNNPNLTENPQYRTDTSLWDDAYFWSFCVEIGETFIPGHTYKVDAIADHSYASDMLLTGYTAWIYSMFREIDGWTLPNEILSDGISGEEYNHLQNAVWAGMVGSSGVVGGSDAELSISLWGQYETLGIGYSDFLSSSWGTLADLGSVRVMHMGNDGLAQDQLAIIPEPASVLIWCLLGAGSWLGMRVWRGGRRIGRPVWSPENRQAIQEIIAGGHYPR